MDSLRPVRNEIMYVLLWRTVSVLTWVLFWYLFPSLLCNSGNKHQNSPLVSAETVRHLSTCIILYIFKFLATNLLAPTSGLVSANLPKIWDGTLSQTPWELKLLCRCNQWGPRNKMLENDERVWMVFAWCQNAAILSEVKFENPC